MSPIELIQIGLLLIISAIGLWLLLIGRRAAAQWQRYTRVEEITPQSERPGPSQGHRPPSQWTHRRGGLLAPDFRSAH